MTDVQNAPAEKAPVLKQNGIKRPDSSSQTGKLWDIADEISNAAQRPATRKEVVDRYMAEVPGANQATANTQYARWVSYHNVSEVLREQRKASTEARRAEKESGKTEAQKAKEAAKAAEQAEKEAAKARKAEERKAKQEAIAAEREATKQRKADEKAAKDAAKAAAEAEKKAAA